MQKQQPKNRKTKGTEKIERDRSLHSSEIEKEKYKSAKSYANTHIGKKVIKEDMTQHDHRVVKKDKD
jgi:hypothetical protein